MDLKHKPKRKLNVRFNVLQQKKVLSNREQMYELDETGLLIWEKCNGENTIEEIAQHISHEYDVSYEDALNDCKEFLQELVSRDLCQ